MQDKVRIFSMDLSLNLPGFALLEIENNKVTVLNTGYVDNKKRTKDKHGRKINAIYRELCNMLSEADKVDYVVREKGFSRFAGVTQTLFKVVGISDLAVYQYADMEVHEITPTTVKKLVTGNGKAEKDEVAEAVERIIENKIEFYSDDVSDAVAVGIAFAVDKGILVI